MKKQLEEVRNGLEGMRERETTAVAALNKARERER